ncbi:MAG: nitrite reductase small subunit NirD [Arenicella sp.]
MTTHKICSIDNLIPDSGVCALIEGSDGTEQQVALFYLPDSEQQVYAINNWDSFGKANVLSRGLVGSIGEELVVASPLYKQHFSLTTGVCIEEQDVSVPTYDVTIEDNSVFIEI